MSDVIYVKLDIVYSINQQLNETISRKSYFFETVKSKVIISLFETVRLSVSISPRNLYYSLKSIKEYLRIYCRKFLTYPIRHCITFISALELLFIQHKYLPLSNVGLTLITHTNK